MGKNNRHQKNLKSEKAKVKLKAKKLPKGQNITDTTFKAKKILIREQLKSHDTSEILSRRKLNVKDLLTRLQHHNSTVRQEAIKELREIIQQYPVEILNAHLSALLQGIASLTLDKEKDIRRDTLKVLNLILGPISKEKLAPFSDILISYLCCAMTHIVPTIKEDSLNFLDILVQNSSNLIAKNARKILPNFLDMISKHHSHSNTTRHLVVTLNSKNTSIKWRIKVLERLASILTSIIIDTKSQNSKNSNNESKLINEKIIIVEDKKFYIPLYHGNYLDNCKINFDEDYTESMELQDNVELNEFNKYIGVLMPLMLESWLEVKPKTNTTTNEVPLISIEASVLLRAITSVMQLIVEYIEVLEPKYGPTGESFRKNFQNTFAKYLLTNFPYCHVNAIDRLKKRQADFESTELINNRINNSNNNCLEQNLGICYVYMWMISTNLIKKINNTEIIEYCERILEFVNDTLINWSNQNAVALPQLIKLLRVIFLRSSKVLYKSGVNLGSTLQSLIVASSRQPKRELHTQLFSVLSDIIMDHNLNELHDEPAFKEFVKSLPDLLLKNSIYENTIKILNRVVLQYRNWIRDELAEKQNDILENAKIIQIIGAVDEKQSRLMICNLFHFMDGQIYF
ncbi:hypothetical protein PV328_004482 [Microctonus aethiopoides]|uniref:Pre-rRNA-processing protein Ipi1 N-terminal domain-containing protein n=1 Tax=Microctonus aethiopoides TaxID=144406 RepID=A0AA39FAK8_9HYME|nr:hypothetical protein PV328_004482 [Microctonus aethiopoides]